MKRYTEYLELVAVIGTFTLTTVLIVAGVVWLFADAAAKQGAGY